MGRIILHFCICIFLLFCPFVAGAQDNSVDKIFKDIAANSRYIDMLNPANLEELPVGITKSIGNIKYTVAFVRARVLPEYAELSVFAQIELPQKNGSNNDPKVLFFGADNVKFSYNGGIVGDARLVLLNNVTIPFNGGKWGLELKGGIDKATGNFADLTYVSIDCEGFKELGLAADVVFSRDLLIPLDATMHPDANPGSRVRGSFRTIVRDWNDLLAEISFPPFTLASDTRFGFMADHAVFDFSDLHNASDIQFPAVYNTLLDAGNPNLWRGVYINALKVVLPEEFSKQGSNDRISFGAQQLLIDNYGVSGNFYATNIIKAGEGSASGWAFTVDSIALRIETNQLKSGYFNGNLKLPVSEQTDLRYTAAISDNDYLIAVQNNKPLDFSAWKAKLHLDANSAIVMEVRDHQFRPKAILNGYMAVTLADDPAETTTDTTKTSNLIPKLSFQELTLQTEAPYLQVKAMGYQGEIKFNNFPLSLNKISLAATAEEARLNLDIRLNLMEQFSASGGIGIVGKIENTGGRQRWKYDHLSLDEIGIAADLGAFDIKGKLVIMKNDPVYGNGFNASIALNLKTGMNLRLASQAIFGNAGYRYWMVDGIVDGLTVPIGPLIISGFGGGASNRMAKTTAGAPDFGGSGLTYVPDSTLGLGLKATVLFHIASEKLVNGNIAFEMLFNRNGGLNKMGFYGQGEVLTTSLESMAGGRINGLRNQLQQVITKEEAYVKSAGAASTVLSTLGYNDKSKLLNNLGQDAKAGSGSISLQLGIEYDFQNSVLHATSEMYVNFLGGILKGRGPNGRAGWSVLHVEPGSWYMHLGTPEDRLGLKLGVGSFNVESGGYFMMGDKLPDQQQPPKAVCDILGMDASELNASRDLAALSGGRGVAFGADFSLSTGDLNFLLLYASFNMGAGMDIMMRDYGSDAHCAGSSKPVGINGWYANGQAYAYLQGELGVAVKLLFIDKKISIIKGAAAMLVQARAPNPIWAKGYLSGNYNLLGGLVSGGFHFKVEVGDKCEVVSGSSPLGLAVIADISPADKTDAVDVFAAPQVAFNMKVNKNFLLEDDNGSKTYYIGLEQMSLSKDGQSIPGNLEWNSSNDGLSFRSLDILPARSKITAKVKVSFYEVKNGNNVLVYTNGQPASEEKEISFTTGDAPNYIPLSSIQHCYPLTGQQNYYPQERNTGYVQLKQGRPDLFGSGSVYEARIISGSDSVTVPLSYSNAERILRFDLPQIANSQACSLKVISRPQHTAVAEVRENVAQTQLDDNNTLAVRSKTISGTATNAAAAAELLGFDFRSSKYGTFARKMQAIRKNNDNISKLTGSSDVVYLSSNTDDYEPFDLAELSGIERSSGTLVQVSATLDDDFYKQQIYPLIYQDYPVAGNINITGRDLSLGVPPAYAISVISTYKTYTEQQTNAVYRGSIFPYRYDLVDIYSQDFHELQSKVVNQLMGTPSFIKYSRLVTGVFPLITKGNYKIQLQYRFPDGREGSKAIYSFYNPIN